MNYELEQRLLAQDDKSWLEEIATLARLFDEVPADDDEDNN